jgi:hypothetical protein
MAVWTLVFTCRRSTVTVKGCRTAGSQTVDAARECGFAAISANDHFLFFAPWLDGLTALAAVVEWSSGRAG